MKDVTELPVSRGLQNHVHVVRHDHPYIQGVALAVEMLQRLFDNLPWLRLTQDTFAVTAIEPALAFVAEAALIFVFGFRVPRLRMKLQPGLKFFAPLSLETRWNGVGETEGHEVGRTILAPVRQL